MLNRLTRKFSVKLIVGIIIVFLAGCAPAAAPVDTASDIGEATTEAVSVETSEASRSQLAGSVDEIDNPVELSNEMEPLEASTLAENESSELGPAEMMRETRAIWSWAGRKPLPGRKDVSRFEVDDLVAQVDAAHLNVIFLAVYKNGTTFFEPSHTRFPDSHERLVNKSDFVTNDDEFDDALSYLLSIRDTRRTDDDPTNDFEVHAWFNVHVGGAMEKGKPPIDKTKPYMLNAIFPEFKVKDGFYYSKADERYIWHDISDFHQPRFRAYMADLIAGLVEDYDVDGVHLDNIRTGALCFNNEAVDYPGTEYDYPGCQEDYKAWTKATYGQEYSLWDDTNGHNRIQDGDSGRVAAWQEQVVGKIIKEIHDEVKAVRPDVIISVAASTVPHDPEGRRQSIQGRVGWEWLDNGWIDAAFMMTYTPDTSWIVNQIQDVRGFLWKVVALGFFLAF